MRLSTRGRYSARAMLDLALNYKKGSVILKDVAKRQGVSQRYLERILNSLVSAGVVRSTRGKRGGFSLARNPRDIYLKEIIEISEGSISPVECIDDPKVCERHSFCVTRDIWIKLKKAMSSVLENITLEDMVKMHKKKAGTIDQMYYI